MTQRQTCSVRDCVKQHHAKGFCKTHYLAQWRWQTKRRIQGRKGGYKHGLANKTRTYAIWKGMRVRCTNPNSKSYPRYGGRGISICPRWNDYVIFLADMGEAPDGMTIERNNNNGNYEPGNCRWATHIEQVNNKTNTIRVTYQGEIMALADAARIFGIKRSTLYMRLHRGYSVEDALTNNCRRWP